MTLSVQQMKTGASWLYLARWFERVLEFISLLVLARFLSPSDFGLVAIAGSVAAIIEGLAAFDVDRALIRIRDHHRALFDSAWTLSAIRGVLASICLVGVATFTEHDSMRWVLVVLAINPILNGLRNPMFLTFERELVFSKLAIVTLGAKLGSVTATILLAITTRSHWALVAGILAGSGITLVASYLAKPYRPRISFARCSQIFQFSGWLTLTSIVTTISMETDKLIVGRFLGVTNAGHYYMTQRIGVLPTRELISPLQRLLFPSFSSVANDLPRLRRVARESINVVASLSLPAACGFALVANDFVPLALGTTWTRIVPLLVVLVPFLGVRATLSVALPSVMALGETRRLFWVSSVYACVHIPVFVAGTAHFGLEGAIWSIVAAGMFYSYLNVWLLRATLEITFGEIIGQLHRPLLATGIMASSVFGIAASAPLDLFSTEGSALALVIKVGCGALFYATALFTLWRFEGRPTGLEYRLAQLLATSRNPDPN